MTRKSEITQAAKDALSLYPLQDQCFVCEDGHVYFDERAANDHKKQIGGTIHRITREEVYPPETGDQEPEAGDQEPEAKKPAIKKPKGKTAKKETKKEPAPPSKAQEYKEP